MNPCFIALDFDGTVVEHRYPAVGGDIGAAPVLRRLVKNGHKLILNTMRSHNSQGIDTLKPALEWFENNIIPLYGVNENPSQKEWTSSPKVHGNLYIDDSALGAPVKADSLGAACLDWSMVSLYLMLAGLLSETDIIELLEEGVINPEHVKVK